MTRRARRTHSAAFKVKVAITAIKGDRTLSELADLDAAALWLTQPGSGPRALRMPAAIRADIRRLRRTLPPAGIGRKVHPIAMVLYRSPIRYYPSSKALGRTGPTEKIG